MGDVSISASTAPDRPFLRRMFHEAAVTTYADLAALGRITLRERLDELFEQHEAAETRRVWLARGPAGEPLGMVWVQAGEHPITGRRELLVLALAVDAPHRGRGLGRQLMAHARAYAEARGIPCLRLFVAADNAPAVALYRGLGFGPRTHELVWEAPRP